MRPSKLRLPQHHCLGLDAAYTRAEHAERHDLDVRERAAGRVEEFEALGVLPPLGSTAARLLLRSA